MDLDTRRRRTALFLFFLIPGLSMSSWVTRTPDVRDQLGASTAQMGLILFGLSVGSMIGILCSGTLVGRFGSRPVMGVATVLITISMAVIGLGAMASSAPLVTAGLLLFGAGMGGERSPSTSTAPRWNGSPRARSCRRCTASSAWGRSWERRSASCARRSSSPCSGT